MISKDLVYKNTKKTMVIVAQNFTYVGYGKTKEVDLLSNV